eukprot:NODE_140_length_17926_cov_0.139620.p5 type:complete len:360 gc:universal NODE_140_length_17926_cov_0.139620:2447-3526(+)
MYIFSFLETSMKVLVIKVGTASVIPEILENLASICKNLHNNSIMPVIVSSGAVGFGKKILKFDQLTLARKQALASVGQPLVMQLYSKTFEKEGLVVAQLLLGRNIINDRQQYLNAKNTILELLKNRVVPIINENDSVVVQELKFGDNDRLSAFVAEMVEAQSLVILTDVDGLYSQHPSKPTAFLIPKVYSFSSLQIEDLESTGTSSSTGGMLTKIIAAEYATAANIDTWIVHAFHTSRILEIVNGNKDIIATNFAAQVKQPSRSWWIKNGLISKGKIYLDDGAVIAMKSKANLFIFGIFKLQGSFYADQAVELCNKNGDVFGKGIVNYSATELDLLMKAKELLEEADIVIFRENVYLVQ